MLPWLEKHWTVEIGKYLWRSSSAAPCSEQVGHSRLLRAVPSKAVSFVSVELHVSQFVPIVSCSFTGYYQEEPGSIPFSLCHHLPASPFRCSHTCLSSHWAFSSPGWTHPAVTASPHMTDASIPSSSLWPSLNSLQHVHVSPLLGGPGLSAEPTCVSARLSREKRTPPSTCWQCSDEA